MAALPLLSAQAGAAAAIQAPAIAAPIHCIFTRHPSPNFNGHEGDLILPLTEEVNGYRAKLTQKVRAL
jgi:hypothetical protein